MGTWSLVVPTVSGGATTIALAELEVSVRWARASGLAPVSLIAPGEVYQKSVAGRRELVLHGHTRKRELVAAKRKQLLASLGPALELETGVQLQYAGSARTLELDCRFAGGLEDF